MRPDASNTGSVITTCGRPLTRLRSGCEITPLLVRTVSLK